MSSRDDHDIHGNRPIAVASSARLSPDFYLMMPRNAFSCRRLANMIALTRTSTNSQAELAIVVAKYFDTSLIFEGAHFSNDGMMRRLRAR